VSVWRRARSLFPATQFGVHLDHAGAAPVSSRVEEAVRLFIEAAARRATSDHEARVSDGIERVRGRVAALLSARPAEIAFLSHSGRALAEVACDVDWRRGDAIAVGGDSVPQALAALERRGIELRRVPREAGALQLESLDTALRHPRVRLLFLAAVDPESGARAPLAAVGRLCQERGVLLCVDANPQLGALALDVGASGVDYLVCDAHRFLLGVAGTAVLFRSGRCARSETSAAADFESDAPNALGITALGAAVDLLLELDPERVERRVLGLTDRLHVGLEARGIPSVAPPDDERSPIVCFRLAGETPERTAERLRKREIRVAVTSAGVRVSPHCYLEPAEIDATLAAL